MASILVILACSDSDDDNTSIEGGFNETCRSVTLPDGLTITKVDGDTTSTLSWTQEILTDYINCISACDPDDLDCMMGCLNESGLMPSGGSFSLAITLTNTSLSEINYTVEPGIWFDPASSDNQPMLMLTEISITISPGGTETVALPVFCMALDKDAPSDGEDIYSVCDLASTGCIKEIIDILKDKEVASMSFEDIQQIQSVVWSCTDDTLQQGDLDTLSEL